MPNELQGGNPAVSSLAILGELLAPKFQVENFAEKFLSFIVCEQQVVAVNVGKWRMSAQPTEGQGRHLPRDNDEVQNVRQVSEQPIEYRMDGRVPAEVVIVVQDQNQLLFDSLQNLVQENVDGAFRMLGEFTGSFLQVRKESLAKPRHLLPNPKCEVTKENRWIGIRMVELIPDKLSLVDSQKVRDQGSLAGTGIGGDQRK